MNKIGFKTGAVIAQEAEEKAQAGAQQQPLLQGVTEGMLGNPQVAMDGLKVETVNRVNHLGSLILSEEFAVMPIDHKQQVLAEFIYMTKVADAIVK